MRRCEKSHGIQRSNQKITDQSLEIQEIFQSEQKKPDEINLLQNGSALFLIHISTVISTVKISMLISLLFSTVAYNCRKLRFISTFFSDWIKLRSKSSSCLWWLQRVCNGQSWIGSITRSSMKESDRKRITYWPGDPRLDQSLNSIR